MADVVQARIVTFACERRFRAFSARAVDIKGSRAMMDAGEAKYIAKSLTLPQCEIVTQANSERITSLKTISDKAGIPFYIIKTEAKFLEAMNLLTVVRSRMGGQFHFNCVKLNGRGLEIQARLSKQRTRTTRSW